MKLLNISLIFFIFSTQVFADYENSIKNFKLSIEEIQQGLSFANSISETRGATGTLDRSEMSKIVNHAKKALEYSKLVKEEDLDKLDPSLFFKSLSKNYENLFRKGLMVYIEAWNEGDIAKGLKANRLLNDWGDYYNKLLKK